MGAGQAERQPALHTEEERLEQFHNRLRSEGRRVLHSDVERKLVALKQELVEQLWLQRGPFWEAVRDMRARWGITAVTAIPATMGAPGPPEFAPKAPEEGGEEAEWDAFGERWSADLFSIRDRTVPRYFHEGVDWWDFLNTCVLYDPPVPGLHEFASRGGIMFSSGVPERPGERHGLPTMARPPIQMLRDPEELEALEVWRWVRLMQELQERYLKPLGLNVWEMLDDIEGDPPPGLVEEYFKRLDPIPLPLLSAIRRSAILKNRT